MPDDLLRECRVAPIDSWRAQRIVLRHHYLRRRAPISFAFGIIVRTEILGVITFGIPASRHMLVGACPTEPESVIELNRLWCDDAMPRNTESWFVSRALAALPPLIVLSYADTAVGHDGTVYRACNFHYAGWTDMERKTPRFDYVVPGLHSRAAFRGVKDVSEERVRRLPKVKYWAVTGTRRDRRRLVSLCRWPILDWRECPPPSATPCDRPAIEPRRAALPLFDAVCNV